ncbi:UNVERIFIED_CONTAM: hypothetical protein FKN15_055230 [Acipenser sinensis]
MVGPLARVFVFSCLNVFCYVGLAAHSASCLPLSSKKALEDPTALFGPPLETAFEAQKTEVVILESEVWGVPRPSGPNQEAPLPRPFPTGSSSSPARPATPLASSSPTPPPPPPRPPSRPKLPPGKPGAGDVPRPFSPPAHSSSPPTVAPLARCESTSSISSTNSLSAATTPTVGKDLSVSVSGSSRGPSPLTMGAQDTLPVAAAFTETVNAYFKGADPSNDATQSDANSKEFWVNMPSLMTHLKKVAEQKPQATYYNVDMLKYQVSAQSIQSTPLNLAVSWRCEPASTDLRIDYKYNADAMKTPVTLNNVQFLVPVDGGVTKLQAVLPPAAWNSEQQRILWKIPDISQKSENGGVGSLLARFQLSEGPSKPSPLAVQFTSEGSTLSGCDIELVGPGYRFSLIKKRFAAVKPAVLLLGFKALWVNYCTMKEVTIYLFLKCIGRCSMSTVSYIDEPGQQDDNPRPVVQMENTYQLGPAKHFPVATVSNILRDVLTSYLQEEKYEAELCRQMTKTTSEVIKASVKDLMIPRYKIIVLINIGQLNEQNMRIGSRCLWDPTNDTFSSYTFKNTSLFAVANVYTAYFE